ncbi:hypothetical protein LEMLEM_LOCUS23588 [Lemmus lemmus]
MKSPPHTPLHTRPTSPVQKMATPETHLTVNADAVIIVAPLVWRKRNGDRERQAWDEAMLLEGRPEAEATPHPTSRQQARGPRDSTFFSKAILKYLVCGGKM